MKRIHSDRQIMATSEYEVLDDAGVPYAYDPKRAHTAAGDPRYEEFVSTCGICQATALAEAAAKSVT